MSDNPLALLQQGGALTLPQAIHSVMDGMTSSEMQANVGVSYGVVTIKGKVFSIKYGGNTTPMTVQMNGSTYAAPFFDVVIPRAKSELSKTYYKDGYQDGSDAPPDCWSEDGQTPLGPMETRPIDPRTGMGCTDCRLCPMNVFGSKSSADGSGKGKACADTRKLIVVPVDPVSGQMDGENIKFGGPMLLRVPAASLRVFAEYDQKLQQMGIPYFAVVTRLEFDQTQSFPKFVLKATRVLTEAEAIKVVEIRDSMQVKQILESGQTGAAPQLAGPAPNVAVGAVAGQNIPVSLQTAAPPLPPVVTPAPAPAPAVVSNVVPMPVTAAPAPAPVPPPAPVPVAPPPAPAAFPPAGWTAHPNAAGYYYMGQEVLTEVALRARYEAPAAPAPAAVPPAPAATATPAAGPQVTPALLGAVDSLLAS